MNNSISAEPARAPVNSPARSMGVLKRLCDIVIATGALIILAIPLLIIASAVRLTSPGPALFRQPREGKGGALFEMLKFRSMYTDQNDRQCAKLTARNDPRVTPLGRFIRRTSIDELPQLINVLRGEMSIVGPRPHPPHFNYNGVVFESVIPNYRERHEVRPGITGLAQIKGLRGTPDSVDEAITIISERTRYDIEYVRSWSLVRDASIIVATASAVIGSNVY